MTSVDRHARHTVIATMRVFALLAAPLGVACSDATDDTPCATYACQNTVLLAGNAPVSSETTLLDVQLCVDHFCHAGTIDSSGAAPAGPCFIWGSWSRLCVARSDLPDTLSIDAVSEFAYDDDAPHDVAVRLVITDHDTGKALLDQTRTATHEITRQDNCHVCWQARAAL
jgi:hypothetical protein